MLSPHHPPQLGAKPLLEGKEKEAGEEGISIGHCCVLREEGDVAGGRKRHNMITIFCSDSTNQKAVHCSDSKAVHYTYKYQLSVTSNCLISMKCMLTGLGTSLGQE